MAQAESILGPRPSAVRTSIIAPGAGAVLRELMQHRELAWRLLLRDLSAKYRQSLLGYAWCFLPPLMLTFSFTVAGQAGIVNTASRFVPYPVLALLGTVLWQMFSDAIHAPLRAVAEAKPLLARIRLPYEIVVVPKLGELVFNLAIRLTLVAGVMTWYQILPGWSAVMAIVGILALIALGLAVGLLLAPLGGIYDDIAHGLTLLLSVWFLLTPIMYEQASPGSLVARLNVYNPVTHLLAGVRNLVLGGIMPPAGFWIVAGLTVPALLLGWLAYRTSLPMAIERISA